MNFRDKKKYCYYIFKKFPVSKLLFQFGSIFAPLFCPDLEAHPV